MRRPVFGIEVWIVAGRVIAEDADAACAEHPAQFDGLFQLVQMRLEWCINRELADWRADRGKADALTIEEFLELPDLLTGESQDVGPS